MSIDRMQPEAPASGATLQNAPTIQLIELALRQTGNLVRAEASLATAELRADAVSALLAAVTAIAGIVLLCLAIAFGVAAVLLVSGVKTTVALFVTGGVLAALGSFTVLVGMRIAPKGVAAHSRERVASKIRNIEDRAP